MEYDQEKCSRNTFDNYDLAQSFSHSSSTSRRGAHFSGALIQGLVPAGPDFSRILLWLEAFPVRQDDRLALADHGGVHGIESLVIVRAVVEQEVVDQARAPPQRRQIRQARGAASR